MEQPVNAWTEQVIIPTYEAGKPEKNPVFLEKRVYQGSRGSVYPFPIIESISDTKTDKVYTAVFIENHYLKIMILPQLGGRVQRAYDKIRKRDFIYYNQVIKPALVGLTGPWISGGIEFNWPQHHRPSTFEPVDYTIEEHADGSKTIWTSEIERMSRTQGMTGFTLYPGKAYLEVKGRLFNRSLFPQTFLWWANPAIKVNEHTQSIFPPDVYAVFDHGKRDVSDFPIATGTYYKVDYAPGTDISWYKNIPVPTSYMAIHSEYDFIGSYEHDTQSGMLHVADHHISPGKKQWTWGTGDFGKAWEKNLTDEDGPYIELMCGVYTDNQPDFSWIGVDEEKAFEQYFFPYAGIGAVKNATKEAAINIEEQDGALWIKLYATGRYEDACITLKINGDTIFSATTTLSPEAVYMQPVNQPVPSTIIALMATVHDKNGQVLVAYEKKDIAVKDIPAPASAALPPAAIENNELLYLNGLHLEQYRHATYSPVDYYEEALKRDPLDIRCNNAMGLWYMRQGKPEAAEIYFRNAISRQVTRNPNPNDGEVYFNLGLCLLLQRQTAEAYAAFYKSSWNDACQHKAFFQLARLALQQKDYAAAQAFIQKSLTKNYNHPRAHHLAAVIYRMLQLTNKALATIEQALEMHPFNYGCYFEKWLHLKAANDATCVEEVLQVMNEKMRCDFNNYMEYALDYIHAGLYIEASGLLRVYVEEQLEGGANPMAYYYLAWLSLQLGEPTIADKYYRAAQAASPDYCFPFKVEDVAVLTTAIETNPHDYKAPYYLGNFWYASGQHTDAIACWEKSVAIHDRFATAHRNLSLAYFNKLNETNKALHALEKAFYSDTTDARILMELDQLYKLTNHCVWKRLQLLEDYINLVEQRDDVYLERITLYNQLGDFETANALLAERHFHPWEGGEGKVVKQLLVSRLGLAKKAILEGAYQQALEWLTSVDTYPANLGEGKLPGTPENEILYLKALTYNHLGMQQQARHLFELATKGDAEPQQAIFYNDPQPDNIFYQGLSWLQLGGQQKARQLFSRLIAFGEAHKEDAVSIDYFAVSLPELLVFNQDLNKKNRLHCQYLMGLGMLGLHRTTEATATFEQVLTTDCNHQGALTHLHFIAFLNNYEHRQTTMGQSQPAGSVPVYVE